MAERRVTRLQSRGASSSAEVAEPKEIVWGDYVKHDHLSEKNIMNAMLCVVVLIPSYVAVHYLYTECDPNAPPSYTTGNEDYACAIAIHEPILFANILFGVNITFGFWIIGLLQKSFWLIDPYWTLLPPLLGHLYQLHPKAETDPTRSSITIGLLWVWCGRLTYSYFRREDWKFGEREDWRYTKMAKENPRSWWLLSFFAVGLAQQPMLVGISLPAYTVHSSAEPFNNYDYLATFGCILGLTTAYFADNQLRAFMLANEARVEAGKPKVNLLNTGLWGYSRHPNYLGEQIWWWSFAAFACNLGFPIMLAGTAFNSCVLAAVTHMTEERMLTNWPEARAKIYRDYRKKTSALIPFFPI